MPLQVYPKLSFGGFGGHLASPFGVLTQSQPASINDDAGTAQGLFTSVGGPRWGQHCAYNFGKDVEPGVPAGSLITDAYLRVLSGNFFGADQTTPLELVASLVDRDGLWDDGVAADFFGPGAPLADHRIDVRNTGAASVIGGFTTAATPTTGWVVLANLVAHGIEAAGQTVLITAGAPGNLGSAVSRLSRQTFGTATLVMEVWAARANDGSDDRPNEVTGVLATSDPVTYNTLSTATNGADTTFTFSGANQIALTSGNRYVFTVLRSTGSSLAFKVFADTTAPYATGSAQLGDGTRVGFTASNYPQSGDLPWLYLNDNETIDHAPFGGLITAPFLWPSHPAPYNQWIDVRPPELRQLLQAWVDDGSYADDEAVALQFAPTKDSPEPRTRVWADTELVVSYRSPGRVFVG